MEETFSIQHHELDDVIAKVFIEHDEDSYRVWEDFHHAEIVTAERREEFWDKVYDEGLYEDDVEALVAGRLVHNGGKLYFGLERYRHGGDVYALCGRGNFTDRQWDVSPIVGWISPHPDMDSDVIEPVVKSIKSGGPIDITDIKKRLESAIETFNDAISGNCWGYRVELYDAGDLENEDSCWGFLGDADYCKEQATDIAKHMLKNYKPDYKICECCGQKIK